MLTATKTLTRSYTVSLKISYRDPDFGTVTDYTTIEAVVLQGYTPGIGGEISRVEAYAAAQYPGSEIIQLCLTDDPDVEF
jgi:hypothetical protein